jgi:carboxymethylenebutenolidase
MDQRIIDLYDDFTHRSLDRRAFMEKLIALVGSTAAAEEALRALAPDYARAAIIAETDERITTTDFADQTSGIKGYCASPRASNISDAKAIVIVLHENRGLNPHIQDIARRIAIEGFTAIAPDLLQPLGGTPRDEDEARDLFPKLDTDHTVKSLATLIASLKSQKSQRKIGVIGFCWGGGITNRVATQAPQLDVAISYYGIAPKIEDVRNIKANLMLHYAGLDDRINATRPAFEEALDKGNISHFIYQYEGVNHAFNNDTSSERYNKEAAELAWTRSLGLFRLKLKI